MSVLSFGSSERFDFPGCRVTTTVSNVGGTNSRSGEAEPDFDAVTQNGGWLKKFIIYRGNDVRSC